MRAAGLFVFLHLSAMGRRSTTGWMDKCRRRKLVVSLEEEGLHDGHGFDSLLRRVFGMRVIIIFENVIPK